MLWPLQYMARLSLHGRTARKGRTEVSTKQLDSKVFLALREAKQAAVQNRVRNAAAEAAPEKRSVSQNGRFKARLVVQGFTDDHLVHLRRESPTPTRRARIVCCGLAARAPMHMHEANVTAPFFQGDDTELERSVISQPVQELSETLRLQPRKCVQLRMAVHGQVNAPRVWWTKVNSVMSHLGRVVSSLERCFWSEQRRCTTSGETSLGSAGARTERSRRQGAHSFGSLRSPWTQRILAMSGQKRQCLGFSPGFRSCRERSTPSRSARLSSRALGPWSSIVTEHLACNFCRRRVGGTPERREPGWLSHQVADAEYLVGHERPLSWHSGRCCWISRSSLAAEEQAAGEAQDEGEFVRLVLVDLLFQDATMWNADVQVAPLWS